MDTKKLKSLAISENGFIFDPETGYSYKVNTTAHIILKQLQQGNTREEIIEMILAEFDTNKDQAESDYAHFLSMLNALNVLES